MIPRCPHLVTVTLAFYRVVGAIGQLSLKLWFSCTLKKCILSFNRPVLEHENDVPLVDYLNSAKRQVKAREGPAGVATGMREEQEVRKVEREDEVVSV